MTTINTIEDLIRLLDEHPEWAEALRSRLLTRELIELPEKFAKFAAETNERLDRLESDVAQLKTDMAEVKADVAQLKTDMAEVKADVAELKTDVAGLKGFALESRLHTRIVPLISQKLAVRRAVVMRSPVQGIQPELRDPVEDSVDRGLISMDQELRVSVTDFVLRAVRRETGTLLWVAIEASNKVGSSDIDRAVETSNILTTVFGEESIAVVAGYEVDALDLERADAVGAVYLEVTPE